jgi:hypothetical protein
MQSWIKQVCRVAMLAVFLAGLVPVLRAQVSAPKEAGPLEVFKFRLPDYNADGTLKSEMFGDKAVIDGDLITISNLRVEMYDAGRLVTSFWAETCQFNKARGTLNSDSPVRVMRSGMMMTAEGLDWKKGNTVVELRRNVRVLTIGGAEWFKVEKKK